MNKKDTLFAFMIFAGCQNCKEQNFKFSFEELHKVIQNDFKGEVTAKCNSCGAEVKKEINEDFLNEFGQSAMKVIREAPNMGRDIIDEISFINQEYKKYQNHPFFQIYRKFFN